jgi:DNA-binding NarL/FixJ family response regulator
MSNGLLTRAESRVANLASKGLSSQAIANQLFLTEGTVRRHLLRIYKKLGLDPDDTPPNAVAALARPIPLQFTDARSHVQLGQGIQRPRKASKLP